jgi:hypothetical protein
MTLYIRLNDSFEPEGFLFKARKSLIQIPELVDPHILGVGLKLFRTHPIDVTVIFDEWKIYSALKRQQA